MTTAANGAAIEVRHPTAAMTPFAPQGLEQAMQLADTLARSNLLPGPLRGKPSDVLVTLITGHELGLSPMQAVRGLHVIDGKAVMSADLTVALVMKRREVCEFFRLTESTDQKATYSTKRIGSDPVTLTWTIEQATKAGIAGKDNWKKHPAAMLRARCASALARAVFPDLVLGVYDPDEAEEFRQPARVVAPSLVHAVPAASATTIDADYSQPAPESAPEGAPAADAVEVIRTQIAAAQSVEALNALVPAIKALPKDAQDEIRVDYAARRAELTHA
jgi:hypothetical protein